MNDKSLTATAHEFRSRGIVKCGLWRCTTPVERKKMGGKDKRKREGKGKGTPGGRLVKRWKKGKERYAMLCE